MTYTQPLLLLFSAVALFALVRVRSCRGAWLAMAAVMAVLLLSWPTVALLLSRPLEARYPIRPFKGNSDYAAIVVLSAGVSPAVYERAYALPDEDTFHRIMFAAWLYKQHPVPVLACGARGKTSQEPYSFVMRDLLSRLGVPESSIWTEGRSANTHENAAYGAPILKQNGIHRIALIVDASSMPRAAACFRQEGIIAIPAPSDFYEPQETLLPTWKALRQNELTLHELLGLASYRLRGWV